MIQCSLPSSQPGCPCKASILAFRSWLRPCHRWSSSPPWSTAPDTSLTINVCIYIYVFCTYKVCHCYRPSHVHEPYTTCSFLVILSIQSNQTRNTSHAAHNMFNALLIHLGGWGNPQASSKLSLKLAQHLARSAVVAFMAAQEEQVKRPQTSFWKP